MVKRSRAQSGEAPRRRSCRVIVPPDSAFHSQTRSMKASRPSCMAGLPHRFELALHHHLGGDAGVIGARLPQRVAPAHALEADQNVLQREGERVAHVQAAGHVGRRHHDGVGLGVRALTRRKRAVALPPLVMAGFDRSRFVCLRQLCHCSDVGAAFIAFEFRRTVGRQRCRRQAGDPKFMSLGF